MCGSDSSADPSRRDCTITHRDADSSAPSGCSNSRGVVPASEGLAEDNVASTNSTGCGSLPDSIPSRIRIRDVSSEMAHTAPLALLVINVRKGLGALGIHFYIP